MASTWGEGIFIISDINNSVNSVEIRHLKINHSGQHKAFDGQIYFSVAELPEVRQGSQGH